jgi:signal recognition particle GTPase
MNTDRLARHLAALRRKLKKAQDKVRLLSADVSRVSRRHQLAVISSRIESGEK